MDSPGSDLSEYGSEDFPEEVKGRQHSMEPTPDHDLQRPSKRLRLTNRAPSSPPPQIAVPPLDDEDELSEDTDGSVPASPHHHPGMSQEDDFGQDQVTVCKWEGCEAGDLENMDNLVEHLHDDHIGTRQKKYSCEWSDCTRKGIPHASGYALRAHMRSHTREKPFYCTLPECDRSFTRSDALAKHMRTVHETEALRPSDPVPKHHSSNPSNNKQRLKLILNNSDGKKPEKGSTPGSPSSHSHPPTNATITVGSAPDADYAHNNVTYLQDLSAPGAPTLVQFPPDIEFTERELSLPAPDLFQLLRRQLQWAQQDSEELRAEAEALEKLRKEEWEAKELLVENVMEAQVSTERRQRADRGEPEDFEGFEAVEYDAAPSKGLPIHPKGGKLPWWREEKPPYAKSQPEPDIRQSQETPHDARPPPADVRRNEPHAQAPVA
ncbi:hypothetical protein EK21DRAFT_61838 [Setomelanomma holmii]|uniref:C2H2-type domain-containing protein n=1 Tax=Setomelanomma holmii TaxID=210430 RepID=A0A9P4HE19_9PLEO|nr:hypothetical protein EK21DRAFT_61838 [Setomelanomma holmii]